MPTSIKIVVGLLALMLVPPALEFVLNLSHPGESAVPGLAVLIGALVLGGVVRHHRLSWQWGRILTALALLMQVLALPSTFKGGDREAVVMASLGLVVGIVILVSITRPSSYAWFGLVCPQCQSPTTKSANFLFTKAKCAKCGHIW